MTLIGRVVIAAACVFGLSHCATLPDPEAATQRTQAVRISSKAGWLTYEASQKLIKKVAARGGSTDFLARHIQVEEAVADAPLSTGNHITLFSDGPSTYKAMGEAIKAATQYVHMESYIFEDDDIGNRLADLLIEKVSQGVAAAVMVDDVGTMNVPKTLFDRMRAGGVQVAVFNPVNPLESAKPFTINERSHRKVLVVDGRVGFVGGINVSSVYSSSPSGSGSGSASGSFPRFGSGKSSEQKARDEEARRTGKPTASTAPWRDTHLEIRGPAVAEIERVFIDGWNSQKAPPLEAREFFPPPRNEGPQIVRIVVNKPGAEDNHAIYLTLLSAINSAQKSIHITMAYFVPDPAFLTALCDAARRGVDVALILPGFSDSSIVFHAGRSHYEDMLQAGVRVYERDDALLHAKTAVVDGVWSTAGSSNFDWRSFTLNHEINAVVLGADFGAQMDALFDNDVALSKEVTLSQWHKRPVKYRFMEFISRFGERWL
ncbi:phospholipase D-like domain-containing protein [Pigmentiphaga litoralis]|uniref:phospholipase D-like domain-containing protein n=1 Tax=Pigmentiphaga litoralis TaxID=516702 RepID=UPI003B430F72